MPNASYAERLNEHKGGGQLVVAQHTSVHIFGIFQIKSHKFRL